MPFCHSNQTSACPSFYPACAEIRVGTSTLLCNDSIRIYRAPLPSPLRGSGSPGRKLAAVPAAVEPRHGQTRSEELGRALRDSLSRPAGCRGEATPSSRTLPSFVRGGCSRRLPLVSGFPISVWVNCDDPSKQQHIWRLDAGVSSPYASLPGFHEQLNERMVPAVN